MNRENKLKLYIENLWLKDGAIKFPEREEVKLYDYNLDLNLNDSWLLWEKEMHS